MDWSRFVPVSFVLVWLRVASAQVNPPTNVMLDCHNLHNVLKWSYDQFLPGLKFRVDIFSQNRLPRNISVDPPALQADVSFLSDPNDDYFLQVTAVIGGIESKPVPDEGITFSYFKDSPARQRCSVDLPSVDVTAQPHANVQFKFKHPWLLYYNKFTGSLKVKNRTRKSIDDDPPIEELLPEFSYVVTMDKNEHDFSCEETVCEGKLPMDATQKNHCLTIKGEMVKVMVQGTQPYCATPIPPTNALNNIIYIMVFLLPVGVGALIFVFVMVYRKMTSPSSSLLPRPLLDKLKQNTHQTLRGESVDITVPEVEPTSPTPLLCEKTETDEITSTVTPYNCEFRLPLKRIAVDEGVCADMEPGQVNEEEPGYLGGVNLDEDETENSTEASSGYERRTVLMNIAPDDRAEGYRG